MLPLWLGLLVIPAAVTPDVDFLAFESPVAAGATLPADWGVRAVRGHDAPTTQIRDEEDGTHLVVMGKGKAAWFHRQLEQPIAEVTGKLVWSWRIDESPPTINLAHESTDDSPMRVFVVFGQPGFFGRPPRTIFYTFGGGEADGYARRSFASDRAHVIRVDGAPEIGFWRDNAVDPFVDFRRVWDASPPPITAVGIMQDTDQTGARAKAALRYLKWIPNQ